MSARVEIQILTDPTSLQIEGLAQLIDRTTEHDHHRPIGEHALVELKQGPRTFPHAAFVARVDGALAGYAHLSKRATPTGWRLESFVAPEFRRAGVGTDLLTTVFEDVATQGGGQIHAWAYQPGPIEEWLAVRFGGRLIRSLYRMGVDLPTPRPDLPSGYRIRPFLPADGDAWIPLHNEVFSTHPDAGNWRRDDLDWHLASDLFDASGFLLVEDDKGLVGYCWMKVDGSEAWIYFVGVAKRARGSGLARQLCLAGFAWGTARGARRGVLYVDEGNTPAVRLYERLGMSVEHVDHCYGFEVAPA